MVVGLTVGGTENQLLHLLPRIQGPEYECFLCSLKGDGPLSGAFRSRSIRVIPLRGGGRWDARLVVGLYSVLRANPVDLLQCYTSRANWVGALVGRLAGVRVVLLSDREVRSWMRSHHRLLDRFCFWVADGMVVPSEAVRSFDVDHLGLDERKIWVIPNGVDLESFRGDRDREEIRDEMGLSRGLPWVGYLGRLEDRVKGISYLLEAISLLKEGGWRAGLVIGGEGPSEKALKEKVRRLNLQERVRFLGTRRDVPRVLKCLDLLVLPSFREGCPNVVLEAMAAGTPVLASDIPAVRELVTHGETGWLVPPKDARALAEGIRRLLGDPALALSLARRAGEWVEAHRSMDQTARAYKDLYASLLRARGPRGGGKT